jgi:phosphonate transport system ATP-binding protein
MNISIENINVTYGNQRAPAIQNVSLQLKQDEFVGIIGSSGAGKSTLIRCINLLVRPTSGRIVWNGVELTRLPEKELRKVRTNIGMIFQQFQLIPRLSVLTNVLLGTLGARSSWKNWLGYFSNEEQEFALQSLARIGLESFARHRVEHLSGGQQQRVAIARLLLQNPQIILGDEPVASLDPVISRSIMDILLRIHKRKGLITVLNLHDVELAKQYATRIIGLSNGKVVFDGRPDEVTPEIQHMIYQGTPQSPILPATAYKKIPVLE